MLDGIGQDFRYVLRGLRRTPGFTLTAIATLAVAIGVNTAVFTVTNGVLFRGYPHVDPDDRVLYIDSRQNGVGGNVSYPDFEDWRARAKSFTGMGVVASGGLRLVLGDATGAPETADGTQLSADSFRVLRQTPILGRDFTPSDEAPGAAAVVILNYDFWARRYGKDASVIGTSIRINGNPATVIGVMPAGFDFPHHRVDLWEPLAQTPNLHRREARTFWFAFGRMAQGVTRQSAQAEMETVGRQLEVAYPLADAGVQPGVMDFQEWFIGPGAATFYGALWGAVGFVLLIACANLANLLLARVIGRFREVSVRIALGAGRGRIVRQTLLESLALSSAGGCFGWLIALASVHAYEALAYPPSSYNRWAYALDYRVFFYLGAISIGTGLIFGLAPALRLSKLDVSPALKDGARGATRGKNLSAILLAGEMALATVLLAGAGLMMRSFLQIYTADLGVHPGNVLTASAWLPMARYPDAPSQIAFFGQLTSRLQGLPGVESVALASELPGLYAPRVAFEIDAAPPADEHNRPTVTAIVISPNFFRTVGARVLSGRDFNAFDRTPGIPVAIVNQRCAETFWPGEDPLGKRLRLFNGATPGEWRTVAGVASNIVQNDRTAQTFSPAVYLPFEQQPSGAMAAVARTSVPPDTLAAAFRREIQALDSGAVIGSGYGSIEGPKPLTETLAFNYWSSGVNAGLFLVFAGVALLLAGVGLYAVVSHLVGQRIQEIGIRMAIGATAGDIGRLVLAQGLFPMVLGLIAGLAGSFALTRVLRSELGSISSTDPATLAVAAAILILAAMLGCWIPARRAMRVDPVVALRHD